MKRIVSVAMIYSCIGTAHAQVGAEIPCRLLADTNCNAYTEPGDFSQFVNGYNNNLMIADQNLDGVLSPADFSAWLANFNLGEQGPRGGQLECGTCSFAAKLIAEDFLTYAALPIDVKAIRDPGSGVTVSQEGQIIDYELYVCDGIPDLVVEDRLVTGDNPSENPPAGHVNILRERTQVGAFEMKNAAGVTYYMSALVTRTSVATLNESSGAVVMATTDIYDRIEQIGKFTTFVDAVVHAQAISDRYDRYINNPDPNEFTYFGVDVATIPKPLDYIYNFDTGAITRGYVAFQIDCSDPELPCEDLAGCLYSTCSQGCNDELRAKLTQCGVTAGGSAVGGCLAGLAICAIVPGAQPFISVCCILGAGYGGIGVGATCANLAFVQADNCHSACEGDFIRDMRACP